MRIRIKKLPQQHELNAKKWKHSLGGNLFDGTTQPTQQMNNGLNLYRRTNNLGETEYIYQETPDSEEILLTPINKRFSDDPTNWDYVDANGREYSPRMVKPAVAQAELRPYEKDWYHKMTEALGYDWLVNKSNEYYNNPILGAAARWAASYDNNTNPIKGLWNSPLAYGNVYSMAAKAADEVFLSPNGLQKTIDLYNNSDGSHADRYAWQSSLLGDVFNTSMILPAASKAAKSMYNETMQAVENYRYPFGRPQVPNNFLTIDSKNIIADGENWAASLPGRKDYSITRVEPYSGYTPINQSQEYKNFVDDVMQGNSWGRNRGVVYPTKNRDFGAGLTESEQLGSGAEATVLRNPDDSSRVLKFSRDSSLASDTREAAVEKAEQYASQRNMAPYNMPLSVEGVYESNSSFYPVFSQERVMPVGAENMLAVDNKIGELNNSVRGGMYYPGSARTNNILSENDIARTLDFKPENVGITSDGSIMGIDLGVDYTGRVPKRSGSPQITAENAASITPDIIADANDFSYKGLTSDMSDFFEKMAYSNKIHGKPMFPSDEGVGGFSKSVQTGIPETEYNELLHDVVNRNVREFMNAGLSEDQVSGYISRARDAMNNVHIGKYSDSDYIKGGWEGFGGFYDSEGNFISVNTDSPLTVNKVIKHEGRHLLDHKVDDDILMPVSENFGKDFDSDKALATMQKVKQNQNMILYDAYDNDFITLPNKKGFNEGLENYSNMDREAITTNRDARQELLGSKSDWDINITDKIIDKMPDDAIFEAVEKANGYGRRYIHFLRDNNKLTPEKAKQFREAMKHVGAYVVPTTIAAGTLYKE